MEQVMLLDGVPKTTARGLFADAPTVIGGALAIGTLALVAHALYRAARPLPARSGAFAGRPGRPHPQRRPQGRARDHRAPTGRPRPLGDAPGGEITLFSMSGCQHCDRMRKTLKAARQDGLLEGFTLYEEDASTSEVADARGIDTVPTLVIRGGRNGRERVVRAPELTKRLRGEWTPARVAALATGGSSRALQTALTRSSRDDGSAGF